MDSASKQHRLDQLEHACRQRGLPVTVQRRTVLEMILDREDHPTADQVCDQVRKRLPAISRATVYRILDTLVEFGLIMKICHPGTAARFDPKIHPHHHLVCTHCEAIIDVEEGRLHKVTWPDVRRYGFEIRDCHIHFRGVCRKCRKKPNARETTAHRTRKPGAGGGNRAGSERILRQRRPKQ